MARFRLDSFGTWLLRSFVAVVDSGGFTRGLPLAFFPEPCPYREQHFTRWGKQVAALDDYRNWLIREAA